MRERLRKKRGGKMQDSLAMLLKTHGEKMSLLCPTTMLMKTNQLKSVSRDVHENKDGYLG
jgi:aspartate carbamoyltransferase catalytic subunit